MDSVVQHLLKGEINVDAIETVQTFLQVSDAEDDVGILASYNCIAGKMVEAFAQGVKKNPDLLPHFSELSTLCYVNYCKMNQRNDNTDRSAVFVAFTMLDEDYVNDGLRILRQYHNMVTKSAVVLPNNAKTHYNIFCRLWNKARDITVAKQQASSSMEHHTILALLDCCLRFLVISDKSEAAIMERMLCYVNKYSFVLKTETDYKSMLSTLTFLEGRVRNKSIVTATVLHVRAQLALFSKKVIRDDLMNSYQGSNDVIVLTALTEANLVNSSIRSNSGHQLDVAIWRDALDTWRYQSTDEQINWIEVADWLVKIVKDVLIGGSKSGSGLISLSTRMELVQCLQIMEETCLDLVENAGKKVKDVGMLMLNSMCARLRLLERMEGDGGFTWDALSSWFSEKKNAIIGLMRSCNAPSMFHKEAGVSLVLLGRQAYKRAKFAHSAILSKIGVQQLELWHHRENPTADVISAEGIGRYYEASADSCRKNGESSAAADIVVRGVLLDPARLEAFVACWARCMSHGNRPYAAETTMDTRFTDDDLKKIRIVSRVQLLKMELAAFTNLQRFPEHEIVVLRKLISLTSSTNSSETVTAIENLEFILRLVQISWVSRSASTEELVYMLDDALKKTEKFVSSESSLKITVGVKNSKAAILLWKYVVTDVDPKTVTVEFSQNESKNQHKSVRNLQTEILRQTGLVEAADIWRSISSDLHLVDNADTTAANLQLLADIFNVSDWVEQCFGVLGVLYTLCQKVSLPNTQARVTYDLSMLLVRLHQPKLAMKILSEIECLQNSGKLARELPQLLRLARSHGYMAQYKVIEADSELKAVSDWFNSLPENERRMSSSMEVRMHLNLALAHYAQARPSSNANDQVEHIMTAQRAANGLISFQLGEWLCHNDRTSESASNVPPNSLSKWSLLNTALRVLLDSVSIMSRVGDATNFATMAFQLTRKFQLSRRHAEFELAMLAREGLAETTGKSEALLNTIHHTLFALSTQETDEATQKKEEVEEKSDDFNLISKNLGDFEDSDPDISGDDLFGSPKTTVRCRSIPYWAHPTECSCSSCADVTLHRLSLKFCLAEALWLRQKKKVTQAELRATEATTMINVSLNNAARNVLLQLGPTAFFGSDDVIENFYHEELVEGALCLMQWKQDSFKDANRVAVDTVNDMLKPKWPWVPQQTRLEALSLLLKGEQNLNGFARRLNEEFEMLGSLQTSKTKFDNKVHRHKHNLGKDAKTSTVVHANSAMKKKEMEAKGNRQPLLNLKVEGTPSTPCSPIPYIYVTEPEDDDAENLTSKMAAVSLKSSKSKTRQRKGELPFAISDSSDDESKKSKAKLTSATRRKVKENKVKTSKAKDYSLEKKSVNHSKKHNAAVNEMDNLPMAMTSLTMKTTKLRPTRDKNTKRSSDVSDEDWHPDKSSQMPVSSRRHVKVKENKVKSSKSSGTIFFYESPDAKLQNSKKKMAPGNKENLVAGPTRMTRSRTVREDKRSDVVDAKCEAMNVSLDEIVESEISMSSFESISPLDRNSSEGDYLMTAVHNKYDPIEIPRGGRDLQNPPAIRRKNPAKCLRNIAKTNRADDADEEPERSRRTALSSSGARDLHRMSRSPEPPVFHALGEGHLLAQTYGGLRSPTVPEYRRVCEYLGLLKMDTDPLMAAYYFTEAQSVSFRYAAINDLSRTIRKWQPGNGETPQLELLKLKQKSLLFDKEAADISTIAEDIPSDFCVVQVTVTTVPGQTSVLAVTKLSRGAPAVVVRLPNFIENGFPLLEEFNSIMKGNSQTMALKERAMWWNGRRDLDERLKNVLALMEARWFGCWRGLLMGDLARREDEMAAKRLLNGAKNQLEDMGITVDVVRLEIVLAISAVLREEELSIATFCVTSLQPSDDRFTVAMALIREHSCDPEWDRKPVVLILDRVLQKLPWESFPCLRNRHVTRSMNLYHLQSQLRHFQQDKKSIYQNGVDVQDAYYVLDPENNLGRTQERFATWFTKEIGWKGVAGAVPTSDVVMQGLQRDLFIYCGHGGGSQYFHEVESEKRCCRSACVLMGCSSGRLVTEGQLDAQGHVLQYILAGSPFVMSCLWDVTDRDIDTFTEHVIRTWFQSPGTSLLAAPLAARSGCKLTYLIGAATVVYGLPLRTK